MFDIGFWELCLIGVVALVVIGPERLPRVAREVGLWIGKIRGFIANVQQDINREISRSEELAKLKEEQEKLAEMHRMIQQQTNELSAGVDLDNIIKGERPESEDAATRQATPAPVAVSQPARSQPRSSAIAAEKPNEEKD